MRVSRLARLWVGAIGATVVLWAVAASAHAAIDPLYVKTPTGNSLDDPCGATVDISGNLYVASYYSNSVEVYTPEGGTKTPRLTSVDPLGGPCGLAIDSAGTLYVNVYHQRVVRATVSPYPLGGVGGSITLGSPLVTANSTGVAVRPVSNLVYVNNRTSVAVYDAAGALLETIGDGALENAYGVAVGGARIYVPDAGSDSVEVFEPSVSTTVPVTTISGPPGGFNSLVDAAIAVDTTNGDVYVSDRVGSRLTEHPESVIDVFTSTGVYKGHLKYNVVDGSPVGLAVDNSAGATQGRVYVTSGASDASSFYAYAPGSATTLPSQPAVFSLSISSAGSGAVASNTARALCEGACEEELAAGSEVTLTAVPDEGSRFAGWSGAPCEGSGSCQVTVDRSREIAARFAAAAQPAGGAELPPAPASELEQKAAATRAAAHVRRHRQARRHKQRKHRRHNHHHRQRSFR